MISSMSSKCGVVASVEVKSVPAPAEGDSGSGRSPCGVESSQETDRVMCIVNSGGEAKTK